MLNKFADNWIAFGTVVCNQYINLTNRWLILILLPIYMVFAILYEMVTVLILITYAIVCKLEGTLTFTESFNAVKEGIIEKIHEWKG